MSTTTETREPQAINHHKSPRSHILLTIAAWTCGLLFALPVAWMILTSFHKEEDAATNPPSLFAPLSLDGYKAFFDAGPWPPLLNSLTASVVSTLLVLLLAFPAVLLTLPVIAGARGLLLVPVLAGTGMYELGFGLLLGIGLAI